MADKPELFFALVGAVGGDLSLVQERLEQELRRVKYNPVPIRLSQAITECGLYPHLEELKNGSEDERINQSMDAGDDFRSKAANGAAVAILGVMKVLQFRLDTTGSSDAGVDGTAYIFNSLKHPKEISMLRDVYRNHLFVISAYAPVAQRDAALRMKIARSRDSHNYDDFQTQSHDLIEKDEKEKDNNFGQNVRDTFPLADYFLDLSQKDDVAPQIVRFIDLLFENPFVTPTRDEYGMFHAQATALRSADLSRQVGAVITTKTGEIITTGCNEVPEAGGGSIWAEDIGDELPDSRDHAIGYDSSVKMKKELVNEVFDQLPDSWFSSDFLAMSRDERVEAALFQGPNPPLKGSRVSSILEFGRIVHAEMNAICDAARRGLQIDKATLYTTVFPCHMCARHIISSGILRVVYIEPYPKSLAKELYPNAVRVDQDTTALDGAVAFEPFMGVAPRKFMGFFKAPERKDKKGNTIEWHADKANPRVDIFPSYLDNESLVIKSIEGLFPNQNTGSTGG
ncbi:anti-phage dCTP deaminase [Thalassospiraceae bacterium LMO-JJ14]|nr:anti-phage dCTP deaminase [Thalassospiraceae bacterium LMO-JJ14]